ncbi:putative reverse transcriptase domain-containing protein, partial [Tanacetum coccineum]
MKGFTFSVEEQGANPTITPNVDLTDEALEVLDFDSFDSNVRDDTASIRKRDLRKLRKTDGQSSSIVNTLFEGQEFLDNELAKAKIKARVVETRRNIRIVKNDNEILQAKCKGNIPSETSNVDELGNLSHACGSMDKEIGENMLHTNPETPIKAVQEHMEKQFQVGVSKTKAFKAKAKAGVHLKDDQEYQYAIPRDYYDALKKANLNRTVKIDVYRAHNLHENVKSNGIVESESKDSWTWFLSCLRDDLDLNSNSNITFITNRQKGLLLALQDLFPAAEHRYYVRHIHDNMNLIYKGGHNKELLWKCVTATTVVAFDRAMYEFNG